METPKNAPPAGAAAPPEPERRRLIEASWNVFSTAALPASMPESEREKHRTTFYAGASYLWDIVTRKISSSEEVEDSDLAMMDDVDEELQSFAEDLARRLGIDISTILSPKRPA